MGKNWITFPRSAGTTSRQAHCDLPEGTYEREFGKEGFFGPVSHLTHTNPPTGWAKWEGPLRPRAFDLLKLNAKVGSPWDAAPVLSNASCKIRFWVLEGRMDHLAVNADGDELLFIHEGSGEFFCDFGHLSYRAGDYIMLPRSLRWRLEAAEPTAVLLIEATNGDYRLPDKGLVGPNAIFDPAVLDVPELDEAYHAQRQEPGTWNVVMKRGQTRSVATFPYNPLDVIGWHGDNLPVRVNWRDIRPLMSHRYHLPPSAHTTFVAGRFVVCTFAPRPAEMDPGALKVPFYHSNNDFDEVLFYHAGNFFSRDNIHAGMLTLHPAGFPHGPHPKAFRLAAEADKTRKPTDPPKMLDEVAVMIDTRDALDIEDGMQATEWEGYVNSWRAD